MRIDMLMAMYHTNGCPVLGSFHWLPVRQRIEKAKWLWRHTRWEPQLLQLIWAIWSRFISGTGLHGAINIFYYYHHHHNQRKDSFGNSSLWSDKEITVQSLRVLSTATGNVNHKEKDEDKILAFEIICYGRILLVRWQDHRMNVKH